MSNVKQRDHTPTGLEYLELSRELRTRVYQFCNSPKRYPKSCTFTLKIPTLDLVRHINNDAVKISTKSNATLEKCQSKYDLAEEILSDIAVLDEELSFAIKTNEIDPSDANMIIQVMRDLKSRITGVREAASKRIKELRTSQKE